MLKRSAPLLLLLLAIGCSADSHTYSVSVKNDTESILTLNLAKDGPQNEEGWASPEDIDDERVLVTPRTRLGVSSVPPGRTGSVQNISGNFKGGLHAVLRIYRGGELRERELLAMKPGPDRQDVPLQPGDNKFVVHDSSGQLRVERIVP